VDSANAWLRLSLFTSWPLFVLGGLSYLAFSTWRLHVAVTPSDGTAKPSIRPGTGVLVLVVALLSTQIFYSQETPSYFVFGFVVFSALIGIAIDRVPRVNAVFWSIGRYSYFMYFFHFLALRQLENVYRNFFSSDPSESASWNLVVLGSMFIAATAISWLVAWVSWRIFESPILRTARTKFK
jgi:glucan phosphoethanolaminetransferase (alkaline phosphatase superfamily)